MRTPLGQIIYFQRSNLAIDQLVFFLFILLGVVALFSSEIFLTFILPFLMLGTLINNLYTLTILGLHDHSLGSMGSRIGIFAAMTVSLLVFMFIFTGFVTHTLISLLMMGITYLQYHRRAPDQIGWTAPFMNSMGSLAKFLGFLGLAVSIVVLRFWPGHFGLAVYFISSAAIIIAQYFIYKTSNFLSSYTNTQSETLGNIFQYLNHRFNPIDKQNLSRTRLNGSEFEWGVDAEGILCLRVSPDSSRAVTPAQMETAVGEVITDLKRRLSHHGHDQEDLTPANFKAGLTDEDDPAIVISVTSSGVSQKILQHLVAHSGELVTQPTDTAPVNSSLNQPMPKPAEPSREFRSFVPPRSGALQQNFASAGARSEASATPKPAPALPQQSPAAASMAPAGDTPLLVIPPTAPVVVPPRTARQLGSRLVDRSQPPPPAATIAASSR